VSARERNSSVSIVERTCDGACELSLQNILQEAGVTLEEAEKSAKIIQVINYTSASRQARFKRENVNASLSSIRTPFAAITRECCGTSAKAWSSGNERRWGPLRSWGRLELRKQKHRLPRLLYKYATLLLILSVRCKHVSCLLRLALLRRLLIAAITPGETWKWVSLHGRAAFGSRRIDDAHKIILMPICSAERHIQREFNGL